MGKPRGHNAFKTGTIADRAITRTGHRPQFKRAICATRVLAIAKQDTATPDPCTGHFASVAEVVQKRCGEYQDAKKATPKRMGRS